MCLEGNKQPTDSGSYVGKFSLLNRSDSGDEDDDDDNDDAYSDDDFTVVAKVSLTVLLTQHSLLYFSYDVQMV